LTSGAHSCQRQRRVEPCGDHQPLCWRQIAEKELQAFMNPNVGQHVVVVQNQYLLCLACGQIVEQRRQRYFQWIDTGYP
jgi:hypothetical protein